jgi:hypothetical protein
MNALLLAFAVLAGGPAYDANTCSAIDAAGSSGVTLVNGASITNNVNGSIVFSEAGENLSFDFTSNAVALSSDSSIATFTFPAGITPVCSALTLNGTLTLANSETISNGTNGVIALAANGKDDLKINLGQATTNHIALSSTAATAFDFGAILPTFLRQMIAGGAAYTPAFATDCMGIITTANDNAVITLPDITAGSKGCQFTVINTAAATGALVVVDPDNSDTIAGSCNATVMTAAAGKYAGNAKATHIKGDMITLVSDGTSAWYVTHCQGVWAPEAP